MSEAAGFTVRFRGRDYAPQAGMQAFANALQQGLVKSGQDLSQATKMWLDRVTQLVAQRHSGHWPGGTGTTTLSRRSGDLITSLQQGVKVTGDTLATISAELRAIFYARVQEYGGTFRGGSTLLAIPLPAALDASGRELKAAPRDWTDTFVAQTRRGNLVIFQRRGKEIIPLYVLKPTVTLRPRLGLRDELKRQLPYFVGQAVDTVVKDLQYG